MPSPDDMTSAVTDSIDERTGRSIAGWVALVGTAGVDPLDQNAVRTWLREVHGVRQNTQWAIADEVARAAGWVRPTVEQYVDGQYTGARAALRPVFDAVREAAKAPGSATHRVRLTTVDDVDDEVRTLLRAACEQNG
ncbi:hypothetical protein [Blastococcus sp. CT_GayMR20]|uniref:hypothetical protein n=1 Tax=Blastococcus sp. CT_GayMR20 TaxID=2559609 RepID=UPI001ADD9860|nr:hypothetical protein [Blastococcus sp. CT_GayMR20]